MPLQAQERLDYTVAAVGTRLVWRSQLRCYWGVDQALSGSKKNFGNEVPERAVAEYAEQSVRTELVRQHYEKTGEAIDDRALKAHEEEWTRFFGVVRSEQERDAGFAKIGMSADGCKELLKLRQSAAVFLKKIAAQGQEQQEIWLKEQKRRLQVRLLQDDSASRP